MKRFTKNRKPESLPLRHHIVRLGSVLIALAIVSCVISPTFWVEDVPRAVFIAIIFPTTVQPVVESIPGVWVAHVSDGGYEDLVYVTIVVDSTWTMWLHTSSFYGAQGPHQFRVEAVGDCFVFDDRFALLDEAVAYYRNSLNHQHCRHIGAYHN
jgi:hypothetical protein